jgi:DNA-binding GntR family transcriptional regulator
MSRTEVATPATRPAAPHVEAVLGGDAERARAAVRQHFVGIEERISGAAAAGSG